MTVPLDSSLLGRFRSIRGFSEMNSFSRIATALLLATSLLAGSIRVFAQTTQTQTSQEPAQSEANSKDDKKKTEEKKSSTTSAKPLSTSENPNMIGKRNINKGIIAGMSGSTEKEVRL